MEILSLSFSLSFGRNACLHLLIIIRSARIESCFLSVSRIPLTAFLVLCEIDLAISTLAYFFFEYVELVDVHGFGRNEEFSLDNKFIQYLT